MNVAFGRRRLKIKKWPNATHDVRLTLDLALWITPHLKSAAGDSVLMKNGHFYSGPWADVASWLGRQWPSLRLFGDVAIMRAPDLPTVSTCH
jgi:hypothetical protein